MSPAQSKSQMIVLLGPTASGKTSWGLQFAKYLDTEIISADSRQIYKKMTIGTAKASGEWKRKGFKKNYVVEDVVHHMVDFLDPGKTFTVAEFRDQAIKHGRMIAKHGKIPIVAGGTGLYISALVDNFRIPRIEANKKLRHSFGEKTAEELHDWLKKLDKKSAETIDPKNKRRLIRALEVSILSGQPFSEQKEKGDAIFDILQIGIDVSRDVLYTRINERIDQMIADGLIDEVKDLLRQKYSWELPSMSGIGYRQFREYIDGTIGLDEVVERLKRDTRRYAKRQLTWFRRDKRIQWCKTYDEAHALVEKFIENS